LPEKILLSILYIGLVCSNKGLPACMTEHSQTLCAANLT